MTPFLVGLDISKTCTGVCFGHVGDVPRFLSLKSAGEDDDVAVARLGFWLIDFSKVNRIDAIFFEAAINLGAFMGEYDPEKGKVSMKSNPKTALTLNSLTTVVKFLGRAKDIRTDAAHVQTVRKAFLGQARPDNPKKCARAMCAELGWSPKNDDEADAAAVWFYGCTRLAPHRAQIITPMQQARVCSLAAGGWR